MTTTIEMAERKGRARALVYYVFAGLVLALLLVSFGMGGADFVRGMWLGVTAGAAVNMIPVARWLKPNNPLARLLDDESVREHRRMSATAGFWAALIAALAMALVTGEQVGVSAFDVARVIASAGIVAALVSFATLELRAARG